MFRVVAGPRLFHHEREAGAGGGPVAALRDAMTSFSEQVSGKTRKRKPIGGRLKACLDAMIWGIDGGPPLDYAAAAEAVGFTTRGLRKALEKPATQQYVVQQRGALRSALTARNEHRLAAIAASDRNLNASVAAIRALDQMAEADSRPDRNRQATPGICIVIVGGPAPVASVQSVDVTPIAGPLVQLAGTPADPPPVEPAAPFNRFIDGDRR